MEDSCAKAGRRIVQRLSIVLLMRLGAKEKGRGSRKMRQATTIARRLEGNLRQLRNVFQCEKKARINACI